MYLTAVLSYSLALGMFWHKLLRLTPEEGVALGIMSVMLVIFFCGPAGQHAPGSLSSLCHGGGGASALCAGFSQEPGNRKAEALVFHARYSAFAAAFVYAMVAFRNGKILHIDEIKQWVPSVQYMFAHNTLPYGPDLIGQASTFAITTRPSIISSCS